MNYQLNNIIILYSFGISFWLLLVFYREYYNKDIYFLRKYFIPKLCNGWCLLHFFHYTFLGYLAPDYWYYLIFFGIIFEFIEIPLNYLSSYIDSKIIMDTITNTLGIIFGILLYKFYPKNIDLLSIVS